MGIWLPLYFALAVDFSREVRPILESQCVGCHRRDQALGGVRLDTAGSFRRSAAAALRSVDLSVGGRGAMPPGGPQLPLPQREILRRWVGEGAPWPEGVVLAPAAAPVKLDERAVTSELHRKISATPAGPFRHYRTPVSGTSISFDMVAIPGGEFRMGTPENEVGRKPDEGPARRFRIEPFWMGKFEVTWDEYRLFMFANQAGETPGADRVLDAVSRPTRPYVEMSFGMGIHGYPAISMTQHAANKYTQWLSARTGHFYRLPTEAEWEYACRAGSESVYSFGSDGSALADYAWFAANSGGQYQKVGTKRPNAWGLHDMHGNVMEWTLDQYLPGYGASADRHAAAPGSTEAARPPLAPWARARRPYPHAVRGGSWSNERDMLRCGARAASDPAWKMQDPQLPKSIWYHTDAQWLGFRIVRPRKVPPPDEMHAYWNSGVEKE